MYSIYFRATNIWIREAVWAEKVLVLQWKGGDGSFAQRHGDTGTGLISINVYKICQTKNNLLLSTLVRNLQRITDTNQINTTQVSQLAWNNSKWTALNSKVYENMTYNLQVIKYGIALVRKTALTHLISISTKRHSIPVVQNPLSFYFCCDFLLYYSCQLDTMNDKGKNLDPIEWKS